jgi:hypothetical protein
MVEEEQRRQEGEDIISFLIAKHGVDKALGSVDEFAAKQGGRFRFQEGKQDLYITQAPVAVRNEKFTFSGGIAFITKFKEIDVLGTISPAEQSAILTDVQLFELLGQLKASIPVWNPLSDPAASIMEGLTITADTNTYKDKQTQEDRSKTRFSVVRNEAFNRKLIEAQDMATKFVAEKQKIQSTQTQTQTQTGSVASTNAGIYSV